MKVIEKLKTLIDMARMKYAHTDNKQEFENPQADMSTEHSEKDNTGNVADTKEPRVSKDNKNADENKTVNKVETKTNKESHTGQKIKKEESNKEYLKLEPISEYAKTFRDHCIQERKRISTGWLNFDKLLSGGLSNELYIMAAETSTGKSAYMMAMAESIAASGSADVIYFALEMGRDEFIARGISAISFRHHKNDESADLVTTKDVLYWSFDEKSHDFVRVPYEHYSIYSDEYFASYGENLFIKEAGTDGLTVRKIANCAAAWKREHKERPVVVFVDYLQIIRADPEDRSQSDRKTKMDMIVTTLKALASQIGMPVFTVSSVSRASYNGPINTQCFKESGDTEYTGGILLGWNWCGVTDQSDANERNREKKRCADRGYRIMKLEVMKFRNGERDSAAYFKYYPAYNSFEEITNTEADRYLKEQVKLKKTF